MNNQTTDFRTKMIVLLLLVVSMIITNTIQPEPKVQAMDVEPAPSVQDK